MGGLSASLSRMATFDRYALHGEIASGGTASVYFGRVRGSGGFRRVVAVKRLHAELAKDAQFRAMLLDEARVAARIRHPNVVPVLESWTTRMSSAS
jgi:serine/threonine protein kinase